MYKLPFWLAQRRLLLETLKPPTSRSCWFSADQPDSNILIRSFSSTGDLREVARLETMPLVLHSMLTIWAVLHCLSSHRDAAPSLQFTQQDIPRCPKALSPTLQPAEPGTQPASAILQTDGHLLARIQRRRKMEASSSSIKGAETPMIDRMTHLETFHPCNTVPLWAVSWEIKTRILTIPPLIVLFEIPHRPGQN